MTVEGGQSRGLLHDKAALASPPPPSPSPKGRSKGGDIKTSFFPVCTLALVWRRAEGGKDLAAKAEASQIPWSKFADPKLGPYCSNHYTTLPSQDYITRGKLSQQYHSCTIILITIIHHIPSTSLRPISTTYFYPERAIFELSYQLWKMNVFIAVSKMKAQEQDDLHFTELRVTS